MSAAIRPGQLLAQPSRLIESLAELSLEELANIQITSVSRREESLSDASASIHVVTSADIRRSGVTTLPEALRLTPTLQVARIDSSGYAINARGFNTSTSNKLLVLIDGRTVYTPLFSGVFWDVQQVMLEDVDRIEVISGPGGTMWGSNAVNGVINVITRSSAETEGVLMSGRIGQDERGFNMRYGDSFSNNGTYRVYGKYTDSDNTLLASGANANDAWEIGQIGFRADLTPDEDIFSLQGNAYDGKMDDVGEIDATIRGANILGHWRRQISTDGFFVLQGYIDHTKRDIPETFSEELTIFDVEFEHILQLTPRNLLTWGVGYRHAWDDVGNSNALAFLPAEKKLTWGNLFIQDAISLLDDLTLTIGAKVAYNDYTRYEALPSVRLAWKFTPNQLLWGGISRAVRSPSRIDREFFVPGNPPFSVLAGGVDFESELSNVAELGYRMHVLANLTLSMTLFHSEHDNVRSLEIDPSGPFLANKMSGNSTGIELTGTWQPTENWRVSAGGFYLDKDLKLDSDSLARSVSSEGNDPEYQWTIRSYMTLPMNLGFSLWLRGVGELPDPAVPGYMELNSRLTWMPYENLEVAISGNNLLNDSHAEFGSALTRSEINRSVMLEIKWFN